MSDTLVELAKIGVPVATLIVGNYYLTKRQIAAAQNAREQGQDNILYENLYTKKDAERDIAAAQARSDKAMAEQEDRHRKEIDALIETHKYQIASIETRANLDVSNLQTQVDKLKEENGQLKDTVIGLQKQITQNKP